MPRQAAVSIQNKFIRGYVSDATALSFPEDGCTDATNVVFDSTGRVTRRLGFDTEASYTSDSVSLSAGDAYASFVWEAVSGDGNISFLVVQQGEIISFYNVSSSAEISGNKHSTEINLTTSFLATDSNKDPADYICQFASGNGDLFIVNGACNPFYVSYNSTDDTFSSTAIELKYRDFIGLDDGLDDDERITSTVTAMETGNPNHYYNLLNQGWGGTDALSQWDTARSDLPSNEDYIALYRSSDTDAFDNTRVTSQDTGNRLAPKGHFILEVGTDDRQGAIEAEGYTFVVSSSTNSAIDSSAGSIFTDFTVNTSVAFDDITTETSDNAAITNISSDVANAYIGKNFGASDTKTINRVVIYPTQTPEDGWDGFLENDEFNLVITLYASNSTPASGTDGTSLGSTTLSSDQLTSVEIMSNDTTTAYQYVWVYFAPNASDTIGVAEVRFFSGTASLDKPTCVSFFSGRVFYGGIISEGISNNIYFSQIIESEDQYGRCYQKNDPTSEDFSDLLPDDGGVIKIPEMGTLRKLYAYQNALLCFASNGVWLIQGSSGSIFKADGYQVKKISSIGVDSAYSCISIKGLPAWWGEDGIYTIQFDANYDSFTPVSLTDDIIEMFYATIPLENKKYIKGAYDNIEQIAYWLYNDDSNLGTDKYQYNSVLCMDAKSRAFYLWEIGSGPIVRDIMYIKPADRTSDSKLKFLLHRNYTGSAADQTFGEVLNTNYIDWEEEGTETNYDSYFVTGYKIDGQTQRFFQGNYIFVFLEQETNASCFAQYVFDFTTSANTGKWSTQQQIYNENLLNRNVNYRRLKMRGKGRALQIRFESEDRKPFTIIGWSIFETQNAGL